MGRKLNLSHLSDGECRQILDVIQRDFRLRQREKERIGKLKKKVEEEEEKRSVLSRQQAFNQKHCMRCFSAFGLLFNKRGQCVVCHYFFCKACRLCVHSIMWICKGCITERQLNSQAFEWYYDKIKDRFRRYGSAKVVRSLYKRKTNEYFESPSDQSNTDSGFEHQLSPHRRDNSIPLEDKSTNTGLKPSVIPECTTASPTVQQNKHLLESMRPEMENVSTQWPPASRRNSFRSDSLPSPDAESWQNIRLDPNVYKNNTNEISVEVFCEKMPTSPISKVITQHERFSSGIQAIDPTLTHLKSLSPIPEMSSPECTEDAGLGTIGESDGEENCTSRQIGQRNHCTRSRGIFGKINGSPLRLIKRGYPKLVPDDIDINSIEENAKHLDDEPELETSGILGARSSKQIRLEDAQADSIDSVSDVSLPSMEGTEADSLETQYLSAHSNLTTPDVDNDSPSTPSTPVPGMISLGMNCGPTFWDDITLPHSSSSETLKSDQGEPNGDTQFFSTEEFVDEITNRSPTSRTPCSSEEELNQKTSASTSRQGSEDRISSPSSLTSAKSYSTEYHTAQSEIDSRVTSPQSARTTSSSEYFTAFSEFSETKEDEQNNNTRDSDDTGSLSCCSSHESLSAHSEVGESKTGFANISTQAEARAASVYARDSDDEDDEDTPNNSPTNKLIRYDSLSLVVEVSEDDGEPDPPFPAYHMPRFSADYDSGHDSYSSESSIDHNRRRALRQYFRNERRLSPSSEEDPNSRPASFDSVDSYSHKSTSLSSRQASTESTRTSDAGLSLKSSPDVEQQVSAGFSSNSGESDKISQKMNITSTIDTLNTEEHYTEVQDILEVSSMENTGENGELCVAVSDIQRIDNEDTCITGASAIRDGLTPHEHSTPEEETVRNLIKTVPSILNPEAITLQSPPEKRKTLSTKAELDLTNLSKKVLMRRDEVLESAEEMLSSANQMSDINDQMEELEQCLSSLEKTLVGDSDSDHDDSKQNGGDLSPQDQVVDDVHRLEQKLQVNDHCLGMETEQTAAIAVRMITNTALKVIATTENVIQTEHAQFASTDKILSATRPEESSEYISELSMDALTDLKKTSIDSVQEAHLMPLTNANEMHTNMQMISSTGENAAKTRICNTDLAVERFSVEENGNCFVSDQSIATRSSHDTSTSSASSPLKTGARRKDSVNSCRKKLKGMSEEEPNAEHIDEVANEIIHLEEKVYLSASHVFSLEDKLSKLECQVRGLDITASEELIGGLEDELALTLAQVAHSENQVCSAEDRIDQLKSRTGFVQGEEKEDRFSNFLKNVSGSFQTFYSTTASAPVNDGFVTSDRNVVPDGAGVTDEHQSLQNEHPNRNAVSPKEIYCSSLHGDDIDGEYALESDEDEIFLVASSCLPTDLYQKPNSYGTFTRSVSQPEVGTSGSRKRHSFDDKRSVSVTDVSWEMPGLCSFLDDSNIEFQPYSSSEEFSDDSQRINDGSGGSQRSDSSSSGGGGEGDNNGSGGSPMNHSHGQRNNSSDGDQGDNDGNDSGQMNDYNSGSNNDNSQQDTGNDQSNSDGRQRDNDGIDDNQRNDGSDSSRRSNDGGCNQRNNGSEIDNDVGDHSQPETGDLISFNVNEDVCVTCAIIPMDTIGLGGNDRNQKNDVSDGSQVDNDVSDHHQLDTGDLISFNVNDDLSATCDILMDTTGTENNVTSLVFASEANFNSPIEQGHIDSTTQRRDSQFQNDLLINSSYIGSKTAYYIRQRPDKIQICSHLGK